MSSRFIPIARLIVATWIERRLPSNLPVKTANNTFRSDPPFSTNHPHFVEIDLLGEGGRMPMAEEIVGNWPLCRDMCEMSRHSRSECVKTAERLSTR